MGGGQASGVTAMGGGGAGLRGNSDSGVGIGPRGDTHWGVIGEGTIKAIRGIESLKDCGMDGFKMTRRGPVGEKMPAYYSLNSVPTALS